MTSTDVTSRTMVNTDYPAVLALWRSTEGVEIAEGDAETDIHRYLDRNPDLSRVILHHGKLAGAVLCGHDGRRGLIYHLSVAKEWRGRGFAQRLVNECLDGLRRAEIKRVLILVDKTNDAGRKFWERQKFEEIEIAMPMGRDLE